MKIEEGSIFLIPTEYNFAVAKVIYCSKYFKDVILIKLYKSSYSVKEIESLPLAKEYLLYYTGKDSVKKGKWERIGFDSVTSIEKQLSKRIVGGDVWSQDQYIGPASEKDLAELPAMLTYGFRLLEKITIDLQEDRLNFLRK